MNSAKQYDLGHLPIPQYDDESAAARLIVGDDGSLYTVVLFYNAEDYTDRRSTVTLTYLGASEAITTLHETYREADHDKAFGDVAQARFDDIVTSMCERGDGGDDPVIPDCLGCGWTLDSVTIKQHLRRGFYREYEAALDETKGYYVRVEGGDVNEFEGFDTGEMGIDAVFCPQCGKNVPAWEYVAEESEDDDHVRVVMTDSAKV